MRHGDNVCACDRLTPCNLQHSKPSAQRLVPLQLPGIWGIGRGTDGAPAIWASGRLFLPDISILGSDAVG